MKLVQFLNQNSFFAMAAFVLMVALGLTAWHRPGWLPAVLVVGLGLTIAGWFALRPRVDTLTTLAEAEALTENGQPTLIVFFSQR